MKAYNLSKESWHFRLANYGARRIYPEDGSDICEYIRAMVGGTFLLALAIAGAVVGMTWVGFSTYNLYEIAIGVGVLEIYTALLLFMLGALGLMIAVAVVVDWIQNRPDKPEVEPGFAKLAYRKFKNKTCVRLDFN